MIKVFFINCKILIDKGCKILYHLISMIDVMLVTFTISVRVNQPKPPEESESSHFLLYLEALWNFKSPLGDILLRDV